MAFHFKQFSIDDDKCSMKVGTDAVLLGSMIEVGEAKHILEVGTGSGVISLMLAQRFPGIRIDGIEIDEASAGQARQNVLKSQWKERINIISGSFQDYYKNPQKHYDLIISNPPFFVNALKPKHQNHLISKHTDTLSHEELLLGSARLSSRLIVIIPWLSLKAFKQTALLKDFHVQSELVIILKAGKKPARIILDMVKEKPASIHHEELFVRNENGNYTEEYKKLTGRFYLGF